VNRLQLCELLLQNRANVLAKTRSGETVLDLAKDEVGRTDARLAFLIDHACNAESDGNP
jgi:hypothetical protein